MPREWQAVEIVVARAEADLAAGDLWAAGVAGIEEVPTARGVMLRAIADPDATDTVVEAARGHGEPKVVAVEPEAGLDTWKRFVAPVRVGAVVVCPPGSQPAADHRSPIVVEIDPSRSFGSGSHPSTQLALTLLQEHVDDGIRVLDLGCGTGVLAVCAAQLSALHVTAVDVDPEAVTTTIGNAERNGVADRVVVHSTPVEAIDTTFDLVLANLTASTLVELAPTLAPLMESGGTLVASGLLVEQAGRVAEAFASLREIDRRTMGGWMALVYRAP